MSSHSICQVSLLAVLAAAGPILGCSTGSTSDGTADEAASTGGESIGMTSLGSVPTSALVMSADGTMFSTSHAPLTTVDLATLRATTVSTDVVASATLAANHWVFTRPEASLSGLYVADRSGANAIRLGGNVTDTWGMADDDGIYWSSLLGNRKLEVHRTSFPGLRTTTVTTLAMGSASIVRAGDALWIADGSSAVRVPLGGGPAATLSQKSANGSSTADNDPFSLAFVGVAGSAVYYGYTWGELPSSSGFRVFGAATDATTFGGPPAGALLPSATTSGLTSGEACRSALVGGGRVYCLTMGDAHLLRHDPQSGKTDAPKLKGLKGGAFGQLVGVRDGKIYLTRTSGSEDVNSNTLWVGTLP